MSRPTDKNLIPNNERTPEEVRENAKKGGIKSGQVRREKANFKRILTDVFEGKPSKPLIDILKKAGINSPEKLSYLEAIIAFGALKTHSSKTGLSELTRFLEFSRDTIGQKPKEVIEATNTNIDITDKAIIDEVAKKIKEL